MDPPGPGGISSETCRDKLKPESITIRHSGSLPAKRLPENLVKQAECFVREGWAADLNDLMTEALRRYLETHQSEFIEQFIREDISWGLNGRD